MMKYVVASVAALAFASPALADGFRAEIHGGWDRVSIAGADDDGVAYGIGLGYDLPVGSSMFVGIEGNVDDSTTKECVSDALVIGDRACVKAGRDLSAAVRLGWKLNEASKLYVLGGYTNARIKVSYNDGTTTTSASANGDGFRLGAGYQRGFGSRAYGKIEYRYSNYESDFSRHQVLAGIGVGF